MTIPFIDLKAQQEVMRPGLEAAIKKVLDHGQYIMGPEVGELEEGLQRFAETEQCITVASGTEALLIALMAIDLSPGDEVITTPFTFVSTAEVICLLGAKPVFVDIDPATFNIDPSLIEDVVTNKTRAIIPVSLYGQPADFNEINEIASRHNLTVIEDAAQSFGATYQGKRSCNLSDIGCTSFFPSKPLGCYGDGGAIFTSDEGLANICRQIRVHGQSERYLHSRIGVGGRMDTLQCAVVKEKLSIFQAEIDERESIGSRYNEAFDDLGIVRVTQKKDRSSVYAQYTLRALDRDSLQRELKRLGVPTTVHYPRPLNEQPGYTDLCVGKATPHASQAAKEVFSVPMSAYLRENDQDLVIDGITKNLEFLARV